MQNATKAICFLALLLAPLFSTASTVMDVEVTCPIGDERFMTEVAMSGTQFGQNLDRRPFGAIIAPWPLAKCPDNGFVVYKDGFTASELDKLVPYVESAVYQALREGESDYYLVARLMRHLDSPANAIAEALLKATWEAEGDDRYSRYAVEALAAFETLIADPGNDLAPAQAASFQQIAGELERRLGFFDKAGRRFAVLVDAPEVMGSELEQLVRQEIALTEAQDSGTHPIEVNDTPSP